MEGADVEIEGQRGSRPRYIERSASTGSATCVREMIFGQDASFTDEAILAQYAGPRTSGNHRAA